MREFIVTGEKDCLNKENDILNFNEKLLSLLETEKKEREKIRACLVDLYLNVKVRPKSKLFPADSQAYHEERQTLME